MDDSESISVVMAAFNGAPYIAKQLDTIFEQTLLPREVIVSDDGSTDATWSVLERYARDKPLRLVVNPQPGGAMANFIFAASHASGRYLAFCDQDDAWHPRKLEASMARMRATERALGGSHPVLVHTALRVVDEDLELLHPSFHRLIGRDPVQSRLAPLLLENVVVGCTCLANRPLLDLAFPAPPGAAMHDWWLGLVAAAFGSLDFIGDPMVDYRRHGGNAAWMFRPRARERLKRIFSAGSAAIQRRRLATASAQAHAFGQHYANRLSREDAARVGALAGIASMGAISRRVALLRHGLLPGSLMSTLELLASM